MALENEVHRLWRIRKILDHISLHAASLESYTSLAKIITKIHPDEIYHLAAQSYVSYSFEDEFSTLNANINGTHSLLSLIKEFNKVSRYYFAASSEMFGKAINTPQNENTAFHPRSTYGISKVTGFDLTRNYREAYNLFACNGILFNHESPRRGFEFVTRKISYAVAKIKKGLQNELKLGNLKAKRDWGYAKDYVEAMWLMLQQNKPDDFVVGTGKSHSVEEFAELAFSHVNLNYMDYVKTDRELIRPAEVETLVADYKKAKNVLGWQPKLSFSDLVIKMVESDLEYVTNNKSY